LPQLAGEALHLVRVLADGERPKFVDGSLERSGHGSTEEGDADALDPVLGEDLGGDDIARSARHRLAVRQGLIGRQAHDLRGDAFDLHGPLLP
jgi:hypothetical protein